MKSSNPDSDVAFWMPAFAGMTRDLVVSYRGTGRRPVGTRNDGKGRGRRNGSPVGERRSVRGRGNAENATKASVERRQVSESAVERDRQDRVRRAAQADSRPPHSRGQQVLVGRHSDRAAKNAKEVIFAHIRERGQTGEIERFGGVSLDVSNSVRDATGLAPGGRHRRTNAIRKGGDDRLDQSSRNLLDG